MAIVITNNLEKAMPGAIVKSTRFRGVYNFVQTTKGEDFELALRRALRNAREEEARLYEAESVLNLVKTTAEDDFDEPVVEEVSKEVVSEVVEAPVVEDEATDEALD